MCNKVQIDILASIVQAIGSLNGSLVVFGDMSYNAEGLTCFPKGLQHQQCFVLIACVCLDVSCVAAFHARVHLRVKQPQIPVWYGKLLAHQLLVALHAICEAAQANAKIA